MEPVLITRNDAMKMMIVWMGPMKSIAFVGPMNFDVKIFTNASKVKCDVSIDDN